MQSAKERVHLNKNRTDYSIFVMEDGSTKLQDEVLQSVSELPQSVREVISLLNSLDKSASPLPPNVETRTYYWHPLHLMLVSLESQRNVTLGVAQLTSHKEKKAKGNSKEAKATRAKARNEKPILNGMSLKDIDYLIEQLTKAKDGVK